MIKKSIHIALILSILLSTVGFVIQKHFCQDELKNISVFVSAENCHEKKGTEQSCPFHPQKQEHPHKGIEKKDCCNNEVELIKLEEDAVSKSYDILLQENHLFLGLITLAINPDISEIETRQNHYHNYKPPLLVCDFTVSLQTFLC